MNSMIRLSVVLLVIAIACTATGCTYTSKISFPPSDELFVTTGDGDIEEPYTPVGQFMFIKTGYRIPFPVLGLVPIADVDPDAAIRQEVVRRARAMGGDGVINLRIDWTPPNNGFLSTGINAEGGSLKVYGTVINR
jgi:hypothetical protein